MTTGTKKRAKKKALQLPVHRASGNYYKCIGKAIGADGSPKPKLWYFPPDDLAAAVTKIGQLRERWQALRAAGKTLWDEDPTYAAERNSVSTNGKKPSLSVMTVAEGLDRYEACLKSAYEGGQTGEPHFTSQVYRLAKIKTLPIIFRGQPRIFGSLPLPAINRIELDAAVMVLCNRPLTTRHHYEGATEREGFTQTKMSAVYAKAVKSTFKTAFSWLAEEKLWTLCPHWSAIWKRDIVLTDDELSEQLEEEDGEVDHFSHDELTKIWHATDKTPKPEFWKAIILLSLNCGFANAECATLKGREVKKVSGGKFTGEYVIERYRSKTMKRAKKKSWARWYLWPETTNYLMLTCAVWDRWERQKPVTNPENLESTTDLDDVTQAERDYWLLTNEGQCLTENNAIGQGWRRLVKAAGVQNLSFKFLRKTAAHIIRNELGYSAAEGPVLADMLLSHSDAGVLTAYASRDWDNLLKPATEAMRKFLKKLLKHTPEIALGLGRPVAEPTPLTKALVANKAKNITETTLIVNGRVKEKAKTEAVDPPGQKAGPAT